MKFLGANWAITLAACENTLNISFDAFIVAYEIFLITRIWRTYHWTLTKLVQFVLIFACQTLSIWRTVLLAKLYVSTLALSILVLKLTFCAGDFFNHLIFNRINWFFINTDTVLLNEIVRACTTLSILKVCLTVWQLLDAFGIFQNETGNARFTKVSNVIWTKLSMFKTFLVLSQYKSLPTRIT